MRTKVGRASLSSLILSWGLSAHSQAATFESPINVATINKDDFKIPALVEVTGLCCTLCLESLFSCDNRMSFNETSSFLSVNRTL